MSKGVLAFVSLKHGTPYNTAEFRWPSRAEVPARIRQLTPHQFSLGLEFVVNTVDLLGDKGVVNSSDKNLDRIRELEKELVEMKTKYDCLEVATIENRSLLIEGHIHHINDMKILYEDVIRKFERALVECNVSLANTKLEKQSSVFKDELNNLVEEGLSKGLEGVTLILSEVVTDAIKDGLCVKRVKK